MSFATTIVNAIHEDSGVDADECQWANVVHFGSTCTGTYLGDGVVVSAAHCDKPGSVKFGEYGKGGDGGLGWFSVDIDEDEEGDRRCFRHPDYVSIGAKGPDIMYCLLDIDDEDYSKLADVPIISPMMPTGCERDWLSNQVYNVHRCPGGGSSKWSCNDHGPPVVGVGVGCANAAIQGSTGCSLDDRKRYSDPEFKLVRQETHDQDPTSLYVYDSETGSGVMSGDSGGPLYVEMPDKTWRQIGVAHSSGINANYAALPNRLRWIENHSGRDITPCHTWQGGEYEWTGNCGGKYPLDPEDPPFAAQWDGNQGCSTGMNFATLALGECGTYGGVVDEVALPPGGNGGGGDIDGFAIYRATHGLFDDSYSTFHWQEIACRRASSSVGIGGDGGGRSSIRPGHSDIGAFDTAAGRGGGGNLRKLQRTGPAPPGDVITNPGPQNVCDLLGNTDEQAIPCRDQVGVCTPVGCA